MPAHSLQQSLAVIQKRTNLENLQKELDDQLTICLLKIEHIQHFPQQMAQIGTKMKAVREKVGCAKFEKAYNCSNCQVTCGVHQSLTSNIKNQLNLLKCINASCLCPVKDHKLQSFRWVERQIATKLTLHEMKQEIERRHGPGMSMEKLLEKQVEELEAAKQKGVALLRKMDECPTSLESSARSSGTTSVAEHVRIMKMRNQKEKKWGWAARNNKILDELLAKSLERLCAFNN